MALSTKTYCNPLPLPDVPPGMHIARPKSEGGWVRPNAQDFRELADPTVLFYNNLWYLFPSCGLAWVSDDLVNWEHRRIDPFVPGYAPTIVEFDGYFLLTAHGGRMWKAPHPLGPWSELPHVCDEQGIQVSWLDPALFVDDDQRLYCYFGAGKDGIYVVELKREAPYQFKLRSSHCFGFDPSHRWERYGDCNEDPALSWIEGAWMTKHRGLYYLQYSAPGTQFKNYALGCYVGSSPLGPWKYQERSPFLVDRGGFINGCGHHSLVSGPNGTLWCFYTCLVRIEYQFERRLAMDPAGFDEDGCLVVNGPTDTPQFAPGIRERPYEGNDSGLLALGVNRPVFASSFADGHEPLYANDGCIRTWWQARDASVSQWLMIDLEREYLVSSCRTCFADRGLNYNKGILPGPYRYTIEGSLDGESWAIACDRSKNDTDRHIAYDCFEPIAARYFRIAILDAPKGMTCGLWQFTPFGNAIL